MSESMRFHFDFDNYFTMLRLAWRERSIRTRAYYLAVLGLGVPLTASFHALCFALDAILFPSLRRTEVREPVFILGHGRSGTTLTFRSSRAGAIDMCSKSSRRIPRFAARFSRKHDPRFKYSLEEFGREPELIRKQLGDLFDRFGWDDLTAERQLPTVEGAR